MEELPRGLDVLPGQPQRPQAQVWVEGAEGQPRDRGELLVSLKLRETYFVMRYH